MKRTKNKIDEHKKSENQKYTMLWYSNGTDRVILDSWSNIALK